MAGKRRTSKKQLELSSVLDETDPARRARELFEEQHSQPVEQNPGPCLTEEVMSEPESREENTPQSVMDTETVAPKGCMSPLAIKTAKPFCDVFPINSGIRQAIQEHIQSYGFDEAYPLILGTGPWTEAPVLIDGHTRLKAAIAAGCESVPVVVKEFETEDEALEHEIRCQRNRRNLTEAEMLSAMRTLDERRKRGNHKGNQYSGIEMEKAPSGAIPKPAKSAEQTAALLGTSPRKIERARTVLDHGSEEVKQEVLSGEKSINRAYQETQQLRREQATAKTSPQDEPQTAVIDSGETAHQKADQQHRTQNVVTTIVEHEKREPVQIAAVITREKREPVHVQAKTIRTTVRIPLDLVERLEPWGDLETVVIQAVREFLDRHAKQTEGLTDSESEGSTLQELSQDEPSTEPASDQPKPTRAGPYSDYVDERVQLLGCRSCLAFQRTKEMALCRWPIQNGGESLDFTGLAFECPKQAHIAQ